MNNIFGDNLKAFRESNGLSQEELAKILGTSKQVISRYETNQRSPKIDTVAEYARRLNISISDLTGYNENLPSSDTESMYPDWYNKFLQLSPEQQASVLERIATFEEINHKSEK